MKQAIVDRNPAVSSAALISSLVSVFLRLEILLKISIFGIIYITILHILFYLLHKEISLSLWHITRTHTQRLCSKGSGEVVKRWVNEAQEALSSDNTMVQYHAMGLLYHIRKHDRLAVSKMVTKQIKSSLRSPHGYCFLVGQHHVTIMWLACDYHVNIMWISCECHVNVMWISCDSCECHVNIMWLMWMSCDSWMSCECHVTHVNVMWLVNVMWMSCDSCECHVTRDLLHY